MTCTASSLSARQAAVLAALLIAGNAAQAQGQRVFRCVIDGKVTFQQQACPTESDGKVLQVKQGNTVVTPQRPRVASAPSASASAAPARK